MEQDPFSTAFDRLLQAWRRHQDASRAVDDLGELSAARIELDEARAAVAAVRPPLPWRPPHPHFDDRAAADHWAHRAHMTTGGLA
ncbi:MAG: hypothetical protein AAF081_05005 [Actinomycetota bacterium]